MVDHCSKDGSYFVPAVYRICVRGRIPESWTNRLEGMTATVDSGDTGEIITSLLGELADQASVVGVINALYNLHLTVLSVERLHELENDQDG